jgi:hypothetical protein
MTMRLPEPRRASPVAASIALVLYALASSGAQKQSERLRGARGLRRGARGRVLPPHTRGRCARCAASTMLCCVQSVACLSWGKHAPALEGHPRGCPPPTGAAHAGGTAVQSREALRDGPPGQGALRTAPARCRAWGAGSLSSRHARSRLPRPGVPSASESRPWTAAVWPATRPFSSPTSGWTPGHGATAHRGMASRRACSAPAACALSCGGGVASPQRASASVRGAPPHEGGPRAGGLSEGRAKTRGVALEQSRHRASAPLGDGRPVVPPVG